MPRTTTPKILVPFLLLASAWGVSAQKQNNAPLPPAKVVPPPEIANGKQKPKDAKEPKYADLELFNAKHDDKTGIATGTKFRYVEEDLVMTGDNAQYNNKTEFLKADSNLIMENKRYRVTGGKADIDNSKKKLAIITENVIIVLKPNEKKEPPPSTSKEETNKADINEERGRGVTITCDRVEALWKKKFIKMFGNLVFKQKVKKKDGLEVERTLFAEHAEYDDKKEVLHLFKPVRGEDTEGQKVEFEKDVFIGTKEGEETLQTPGKMILRIKQTEESDEEDSVKESPKENPPTGTPKPDAPKPNRKR
jgi:hypothetical protein